MKAIHAVWKNGQILPTEPVDWPEGTELTVEPAGNVDENDLLGDDPESARRWVAWLDTLEPLEMSPEEEAAWESARRER
ncbi:MAG: hypothetical protein U0835_13555 [Isosphaeraceae bacterium]